MLSGGADFSASGCVQGQHSSPIISGGEKGEGPVGRKPGSRCPDLRSLVPRLFQGPANSVRLGGRSPATCCVVLSSQTRCRTPHMTPSSLLSQCWLQQFPCLSWKLRGQLTLMSL